MTYRLPSSVLRATVGAEEVLLNTDTSQYHVLNETGRAVVAALVAGETPTEAASELATRTGAPKDRVQDDVDAFVGALLDRGLLLDLS